MRAVNLLPRDEPRRKPSGGLSLQAQLTTIAVVLVPLGLGAGWLVTSSKVKDHRTTLDALQKEVDQLPPPKQATPVEPALRAEREQRVAALAAALANRVAWDRILRQISSILPEDVWLTAIDAQSPAAPAPAPPPPPSTETTPTTTTGASTEAAPPPPPPPPAPSLTGPTPLVIKGYTYSQEGVARFLARLAVIPELDQVQLKTSAMTEVASRQIVQFEIRSGLRAPGVS
jgi:Tfp pilus assembly protein PilN